MGVVVGRPATPVDLIWTTAALLSAARSEAPAFGLVVRGPDRSLLLLHGDVYATITVAEGAAAATTLCGSSATTWVDHVVPEPVHSIAVSSTDAPVAVDPRSDLRGGLVWGGALLATIRTQPGTAATPTSILGRETGGLAEQLPAPPASASSSTDSEPAAPQQPPADQTELVEPPRFVLTGDDGSRILLDRVYVFGRDPFGDPGVIAGDASPIVTRDPDQLISRVQVRVHPQPDAIWLQDGGSANGTYVAAPGASDWTRLGPEATPLPTGWAMRIGRRVYTLGEGRTDLEH